MHYNGPIIRPHTEANDLFVEVTVGSDDWFESEQFAIYEREKHGLSEVE